MSKKKTVMSHDPLAGLSDSEAEIASTVVARDEPAPVAAVVNQEVPGEASAPDASVLELPDTLTVSEVGELYLVLQKRLLQNDTVCVDGTQVDVIDGAGTQLLVAFCKEAAEKQVNLKWKGASEVLVNAAAQLGVSQVLLLDQQA